jgi:HPt (histidine-containing phosphotransfer) domain-containing protein
MNAFLPKPVNRRDLLDMVAKFSLGDVHSSEHSTENDHRNTQSIKPLLDETTVNRLIADTSPEAASAIMGMFVQELEKFGTYIDQINDISELKPIREMAHSCKSSAGYCGAIPFQELAQKIETACDLQDQEKVTAYLLEMPDILRRTISAIHDQIAKSN